MEISLALGGGGIKGIAHIGVIDCLEKAGYKIRAVAGTSAGGLVGAVYAAGYRPGEILSLLQNMNSHKLYARGPNDGPSLLGYTGLAQIMIDVLGESNFSDLVIPFACTAVDTHTAQEIYINEGRVIDGALATMAFPGIFPPKIRGDAELVDGGVLDPVPVNLARCMNPQLPVVAVVLNPDRDGWKSIPKFNFVAPPSLPIPAPLITGFSRMRIGQAISIFLHSMDISSRMLTELRLEVDKPEVIIRPDVHRYGLLDEVAPNVLYEAGYLAAEKAIPSIQRSLSWTNQMGRRIHVAGQKYIERRQAKNQRPRPPSVTEQPQ